MQLAAAVCEERSTRTQGEVAVEVEVIIMTKITRIMKVCARPGAGKCTTCAPAFLRKMEQEVGAEIDDAMLDLVDVDNSEDFVKKIKVRLAPS